jgi:hypothetical protein
MVSSDTKVSVNTIVQSIQRRVTGVIAVIRFAPRASKAAIRYCVTSALFTDREPL